LVVGVFYALMINFFLTLAEQMPTWPGDEVAPDEMPGGLLLIVLPIFFAMAMAFFNTLFGFLSAIIYNLLARGMGGLEFDLVEAKPSMPVVVPSPSTAATPESGHRPPPPPPVIGTPPPQMLSGSASPTVPEPPKADPKPPGVFE
jgi:hypothetical protein